MSFLEKIIRGVTDDELAGGVVDPVPGLLEL